MPSQQEVRWSQLKIGVIVLVSTILLVTLLFLMTSSSGIGMFAHKLTLTTYFENSAGLKSGAAVNLEGVTIGTVKSVIVTNAPDRKLTPVQVVMKIDAKYQSGIHKDSTAALTTVGVLGDTVVDINSQVASGPAIQDGDELKTLETPTIQDVVKASQGTIESLNVILAKLNTVVDNLQAGKGSIGQLINNPDLYNKAIKTVDELNKLEVGLNEGRGSVGKLMTDDTMYNRLNDAMAQLNSILTEADAGKGSVGMLLKDPTFASKLNDTLTKADALMTGINEGKGTIGKLATDDQAYANLNKLLSNSNDLVTAVRQDPKKYLTIHLKIF